MPHTYPLPPWLSRVWSRRHEGIALVTLAAIAIHLLSRTQGNDGLEPDRLLQFVLLLGGLPLVIEVLLEFRGGEVGSDLLAAISIVTAFVLGQDFAGVIVVLMLSGGAALESFAVAQASSVLGALARRMPSIAHRREGTTIVETSVSAIAIGDTLVVFPHEICPVDGTVVDGHGMMDESYLTGEPYQIAKSVGSAVLSGAINGPSALTIRADRVGADSRFARIMKVMEQSQAQRPRVRRLGDQLGAWYTPLAVAIALVAWLLSGDTVRFLAVLVIATPCPLLIAIPVTIIGTISTAARRSILIRDPAILEQIGQCKTMIFDKTGTLTHGEPRLVEQSMVAGHDPKVVLRLAASLERYSKHPLAKPILAAAQGDGVELVAAERVSEQPGKGLTGAVLGHEVMITGRRHAADFHRGPLPSRAETGLECVVLIDGVAACVYRFRDEPREESHPLIRHLGPKHQFERVLLVSGDREEEVRSLAERVGISVVHAGKTPEEKLEIVRAETARQPTVYVGDGINDAPAMMAATVGLAMGRQTDVIAEAAGAVVMDNSLGKVDELLHLGRRMRRIALESAVGGMALSILGMLAAAMGWLPPVTGAVAQEVIDVVAVLNALRAAWRPRSLADF